MTVPDALAPAAMPRWSATCVERWGRHLIFRDVASSAEKSHPIRSLLRLAHGGWRKTGRKAGRPSSTGPGGQRCRWTGAVLWRRRCKCVHGSGHSRSSILGLPCNHRVEHPRHQARCEACCPSFQPGILHSLCHTAASMRLQVHGAVTWDRSRPVTNDGLCRHMRTDWPAPHSTALTMTRVPAVNQKMATRQRLMSASSMSLL